MSQNNKKLKSRTALLYKIHRYLGLAVAISLIWLSVTGIFLNHTESLQLDEKHIDNGLLSKLYGLSKPEFGQAFQLKQGWLVEYGNELFLNDQRIMEHSKPLVAVIQNEDFFVIGTTQQIILFTHDAELVDNLRTPEILLRMGWLRNRLIIHTNKADYLANQEITEWQKYQPKNSEEIKAIQWSEKKELPLQQRKVLTKKHRGQGPTLEQVILDTHSGRLFGMAGVYFADVIALLTIVLTLMGVYLWYRRIKRKS